MKNSKAQNFERKVPDGYKSVLTLNATKAKMGIIFNLIALFVLAVVMCCAAISLKL